MFLEALMSQIKHPKRSYRRVQANGKPIYDEGDVSRTADDDTNYMRSKLQDDAYLQDLRYKLEV